ncbi:unnamed protein product [Linum tenue]|uniref:AmmeMemoRadiSam system protein B n=1 Tax=Linum tenue TaxID=586396 RepID=A0AAV0K2Y3_9ROSI|nr:unnamed protein product [Linum tenue]
MEVIRRASHAGSWYTDNPRKLEEELDGWLSAAGLPKSSDVRGVIAPHAGYSYSGRAAAYAFGNIDPTNIMQRVNAILARLVWLLSCWEVES